MITKTQVQVNKAIKSYVKDLKKSENITIDSSKIDYTDFFANKLLIIHTIRKGLPYGLFNLIKTTTPFTEKDWADYLNLSVKTLQRHKKDENYYFKPIHTEKIIELAEVTNLGKKVFNSTEQFYHWLHTPSYALGKLKPAELLKDSYGKELVMDELNRIENGIFA